MICFVYSGFFFVFFLIFMLMGLKFLFSDLVYFIEFNLMNLNSLSIEMTLLFDWMSLMFMSFVLFISSMVIYYSNYYMSDEKNLNRFIYLVVLFVFSMMMLILSPNLISILLGWDGLGLVSYCLVIYYQNIKSFNAGMLTILSNRIGDVMILLSIAWMLNFGSWNFIFYLDLMKSDFNMKIVGLLIVLASLTKSAQIPFSSWLPAAMAAPTPVSALVHSSTLVTAGVYLIIRFNLLVNLYFMNFLLFIGLVTMFMSGLGANFEFDLKKIIALSTLSQLGFMMSILALGQFKLAFFHLLIHALFKALLFMCAGAFIHNLLNCQDIRFMGSMIMSMPLTVTYFNISNLSLCGLPFFSGFYSKDLVVEFLSYTYFNIFIYLFFYLSIGLTVSYSFRLSYYLILGNFNFNSMNLISEDSKVLLKSLSMMIFMVIISGSSFSWILFEIPYFIILPFFMKCLTLFVISLGMVMGVLIAKQSISEFNYGFNFNKILIFLSLMWNLPYLSTLAINSMFLDLGKIYYKFLDQGWLEFFGSQNLYNMISKNSAYAQFLLNNNLKIYLILMIMWMIMVLFFILNI